jgi:hypothetical protein
MIPDARGVGHGYGGAVNINLIAQTALYRIFAGQERKNRQNDNQYFSTHDTPSFYQQNLNKKL